MSDEVEDGAAELQEVLTRYMDSTEGYAHAAGLVSNKTLVPVFLEIGEARASIIPDVAAMISRSGLKPKAEGSIEGAAHRWWMSAREKMTSDDMRALLEECIRGEKVLLKALQDAVEKMESTGREDGKTLAKAFEDVRRAIVHFEAALHDREFEE